MIKKVLNIFFQALSVRMASNACFAAFAAAEEVPILHYYGLEVLTMAKKICISTLLLKGDKVDVEEFLKNTFSSKKQIILAPFPGGNCFSLDDMPFELLEEICIYKPSNEPAPIISNHNEDQYNSLRMAVANASGDDKAAAIDDVRSFIHHTVLENLAASIHKEFVSYYHPVEKQQLMLLGNRKTYSTDKNKIARVEMNKKKDVAAQKRSEARAALPSTSSKSTSKNANPVAKASAPPVSEVSQSSSTQASLKPSQSKAPQEPLKNSKDKKRSTRKDVNYREDSGNSTSSVEYPVEGRHTDEESDGKASESGIKTPVFQQLTPPNENFPAFMTSPAAALQASGGPLQFHTRIPKHRKRSSKHSKRTKSVSSEDLDTKPASNKERKRLEKKSARKRAKKSSKKAKRYSSSSSSCSSSEEDSAPSEQVSNLFTYYTPYNTYTLT